MSTGLLVNEVYGAVQGEGPCAGTPCVMVRLHGCPVHCTWCDTAYTWDGSEAGQRISVDAVRASIAKFPWSHVVVTGGEPLIQPGLASLLVALVAGGSVVEVETSGIRAPPMVEGVRWNVSPKMPGAEARIAPDLAVLSQFPPERTWLKCVITEPQDLDAACALREALHVPPERFWLMPEGRDRETLGTRTAWLLDLIQVRQIPCRVTGRLHILAYGPRRGV